MPRKPQGVISTASPGNFRDEHSELDRYSLMAPPHTSAPNEHSFHSRQNLSPHAVMVERAYKGDHYLHSHRKPSPQYVMEGARVNRGREMRDYDLYGRQGGADEFHSRSRTPIRSLEKRPYIDGRALDHINQPSRNYHYPDHVDSHNDRISAARNGYAYKYDDHIQLSGKHEYNDRRLSVSSQYGASGRNLSPLEEGIASRAARQHPDYALASRQGEASQSGTSEDIQRLKRDNEVSKAAMEDYYKGNDKYFYDSREGPYPISSASKYKEIENQQVLIKGNASTSMGLNASDQYSDRLCNGATVPPFREYPSKYENAEGPCGAKTMPPFREYPSKYENVEGPYTAKSMPPFCEYPKKYENTEGPFDAEVISQFHEYPRKYENTEGPSDAEVISQFHEYPRMCENADGPYNARIRPPCLDYPRKYENNDGSRGSEILAPFRQYPRKYVNADDPCNSEIVPPVYKFPRKYGNADGPYDAEIMPSSHDFPKKYEKLTEHLGSHDYCQRPCIDPRKDFETGYMDMICHKCEDHGPSWLKHQDCLYGNCQGRINDDDLRYISHDGFYEEVPVHVQLDAEHKYSQRPVTEESSEADSFQRNYRDNAVREFDTIQKEAIPDHLDLRRTLDASKQEKCYLDPEYPPPEFVRRSSQDYRFYEQSAPHGHEILTDDYMRYCSETGQSDRYTSDPTFVEFVETQRVVGRTQKLNADEQLGYGRPLKRKYRMEEEEVIRSASGSVRTLQQGASSEAHDFGDYVSQWTNRSGGGGLHITEPRKYKSDFYVEAKEMFEEIYHHEESVRYDKLSYQGKREKIPERPRKSFESERQYFKGFPQSESSRSNGPMRYVNQRNNCYKKQKFVERSTESVAKEANLTEDPGVPLKHDYNEDSEVFKQKVSAAFLRFSKKLNESPHIRKLYKDQGRSGALFCIVCGRSASKEFLDSERVARHAYMSSRAGLRQQHLGLFKAICVLMGWNTEVPKDDITWHPQALPYPEAMKQKEDLIIWHPLIIIHNISLSNNNHKQWEVISLEALGEIIRGKSFISSKITISLGHPGDQSVMLVKFLGTFTGLQEAEKLHKYFAENGRGRRDFEQLISNMGKKSDGGASGPGGASYLETVDKESLLYGYMGTAEDLDWVDLDSRKRCLIRSKKEIQDIADAPLKPEK